MKELIKNSINLSGSEEIKIKTINAEPKDIDIEAIYKEGAEKANSVSMKLLRKMQKKIGLIPR